MAGLLADHLVLVRRQPGNLRVGDMDDFDRHFRFIEEQARFVARISSAAMHAAAMGGNEAGRFRRRGFVLFGHLAQAHLLGDAEQPLLALLAEDLAAEPVDLMLERFVLLLQLQVGTGQIDDLLGLPVGGFGQAGQGRRGRRLYGRYFTLTCCYRSAICPFLR